MSMKLYVGNLSYDTGEAGLRDAFGADGRIVEDVSIIMDRNTGQPRGFAFVTMQSEEDGRAAIQALDGQEIDGRTLKVNVAQDRRGGVRNDRF